MKKNKKSGSVRLRGQSNTNALGLIQEHQIYYKSIKLSQRQSDQKMNKNKSRNKSTEATS